MRSCGSRDRARRRTVDNADLNPTATAPDVIVGQSCEVTFLSNWLPSWWSIILNSSQVQYSTGPGTTWYPGEVTALSDKDVSIKWDESGKTDDLPIAITRNQKKFKIVHAPVSNAAMDIQAAAIDESKVIMQPPLALSTLPFLWPMTLHFNKIIP